MILVLGCVLLNYRVCSCPQICLHWKYVKCKNCPFYMCLFNMCCALLVYSIYFFTTLSRSILEILCNLSAFELSANIHKIRRHSNLSFFAFCFHFTFLLLLTASKMKAFVFQRNLLFLVYQSETFCFPIESFCFWYFNIMYMIAYVLKLKWSCYRRDRNLCLLWKC